MGLLSKKIATIITDAPVELDLDAWKYEGQEYNDDLAEFYRRYDMNSLLKRMSLSTETKQSKPLEYKIVETLPNIKKNTALIVGVYDTNYHKSAILGFGLYNKDEAYYISLENAMHDENFKSFLKDEKIEKYGYDIKKCINACRWPWLEVKGYTFDLQLASYILNPSLKDEIKSFVIIINILIYNLMRKFLEKVLKNMFLKKMSYRNIMFYKLKQFMN